MVPPRYGPLSRAFVRQLLGLATMDGGLAYPLTLRWVRPPRAVDFGDTPDRARRGLIVSSCVVLGPMDAFRRWSLLKPAPFVLVTMTHAMIKWLCEASEDTFCGAESWRRKFGCADYSPCVVFSVDLTQVEHEAVDEDGRLLG